MSDRRATGRSTIQALSIIRKAMMNPCVPIRVQNDHWSDSQDLRRALAHRAMHLVDKMGLHGFTLNTRTLEITCSFAPPHSIK